MTMKSCPNALIYLATFSVFMAAAAFLGSIISYSIAGFFYLSAHPGPVKDGYECARGMLAGLCALFGGALGGCSVGCYAARKFTYSGVSLMNRVDSEERALKDLIWETTLGRELRIATQHACSGSLIISFAGFATPNQFLMMFLLGLVFMMVGLMGFIKANIRSARLLSFELD